MAGCCSGFMDRTVFMHRRIYARPGNALILTVPVHGNRDLKRGTIRRLMRDAGLTDNDF
jgi:predicted RNA binding protein YcfA (HicA-like mRNA interferase family)